MAVDSVRVSVPSCDNPVSGGALGGCFPMQERRPCDGDHTQHPSGTAEQDTLRTWVFS